MGDLLFHVVDKDNQITAVTPGQIDHVAIYAGGDSVIEALPGQGVVVTPLSQLLNREPGRFLRGSVKGANRRRSVENARQYIGLPYDSLYLPGADAVYCSELVLLSYIDHQGQQLFLPVPMTFRDSTGQIPMFWQQLYRRHQIPVPEGELGSNPGELAKRKNVILKR